MLCWFRMAKLVRSMVAIRACVHHLPPPPTPLARPPQPRQPPPSPLLRRLHEKLGVFATKVLHLGRRQMQQMLDGLGVPMTDIKRAVHYIHSEQCESYLINQPISAMAGAAGWDFEEFLLEDCAHLDADMDDKVVNRLVDVYLPMLVENERRIEEAFEKCVNNTQAKAERLFCARGVAAAFRMMGRVFFRCAAARARDDEFSICHDSVHLAERFASRNPLYQHPVFESDDFDLLVQLISAAEELEIERDLAPSPSSEARATRIGNAAAKAIEPINAQLQRDLENVHAEQLAAIEASLQAQSLQLEASLQAQRVQQAAVLQHVCSFMTQMAGAGIPHTVLAQFLSGFPVAGGDVASGDVRAASHGNSPLPASMLPAHNLSQHGESVCSPVPLARVGTPNFSTPRTSTAVSSSDGASDVGSDGARRPHYQRSRLSGDSSNSTPVGQPSLSPTSDRSRTSPSAAARSMPPPAVPPAAVAAAAATAAAAAVAAAAVHDRLATATESR